ncbi:MAG: multicopper oxidase [Methanomassiliicoccales archaeon PtaU1.Bin124]|nr:MAG: multicopper oxidase [Methanomassiliicoccales archaeon PtaU1.Bin124]
MKRNENSDRKTVRILLVFLICIAMMMPLAASATYAAPVAKTPLDPTTVAKFVNQITGPPPVFIPMSKLDRQTGLRSDYYTIIASEFKEQILPPGMPMTKVWGYGGFAKDAVTGQYLGFVRNSPSPSIEAKVGVPVNVAWVNGIYTRYLFAVDPTLDWTNPNNLVTPDPTTLPSVPGFCSPYQYPVTIATHLHGAENSAKFDGGPFNWVSWNGLHGPDYNTYTSTLSNAQVFHYDNQQAAGTLWFHDHAMGLTRSNVYSGLAGFYLLRDSADQIAPLLPSGKYDVPLAIQDRMFYTDGSLMFPSDVPPNPEIHPYWVPEFFGNVIMVNGLAWPNMNVDQGQYRFRMLDGSNARFYNLSMSNGMPFTVIASDENYLRSAVVTDSFVMAPGERYDVLVDFTGIAPGTKIVLTNNANAPYPDGDPADPNTNGVIMQFTVGANPGFQAQTLPGVLNPTLQVGFPSLSMSDVSVYRNITLKEWMGPNGPQMVTVDGQQYSSPISEAPQVGATEIWRLIDNTGDAHPMHLHLVNFQVVSRQAYDQATYDTDWMALNGPLPFSHPTLNLNLENYLLGTPEGPAPIEQGWKDTIQIFPGQVLTIIVKFGPVDGGSFPFDVTAGPDYVWHCHIVDHEDQDMIRPYHVVPNVI